MKAENNGDAPMDPEVAALKVEVRTISTEVDQIRVSLDRLGSMVQSGFAEIRRENATGSRTNWGLVVASVVAVAGIVGAIGSAWISPLREADARIGERISALEVKTALAQEISTRTDERLKVYKELGILTPVIPSTK